MTFTRIVVLSLFGFALAGCAALKPPQPPDAAGMAILEMPMSLDLITVNGAAATRPVIRSNPYFHTLAPGSYSLEVGYTEYWGSPLGGELVRSDFHMIDLTVEADTIYLLQHTDPGSKQLVNQTRFVKDFSVWATEQGTGQRVVSNFSRPYPGLLSLFTQSQQPVQNPAATIETSNADSDQSQALGQLKSWWLRASKKERADFLIWSTETN